MNRKMLVSILVATFFLAGAGAIYWAVKPPREATFTVAVVSIVEIDPIVDLRKGFREEFGKSKFANGRKIEFKEYNAQGDASLSNQIADKIAAEAPDLVYVLGTPIAQAIQKRAPELLLVQGAVTDPVAAGLAKSWDGSGRKYIATSDLPPIKKQVALMKALTPSIKQLGLIYNPGETNSVAVISRLRDELKSENLTWSLVERPIANSGEVATAVQTLVGKVDAIYLPPDNTAHAAIKVIGRVSSENKIPLYATVKDALDAGALATLSLDFVQLGRESAVLALEVLDGKEAGTIPIRLNENPAITINGKLAAIIGLDLTAAKALPNVTVQP